MRIQLINVYGDESFELQVLLGDEINATTSGSNIQLNEYVTVGISIGCGEVAISRQKLWKIYSET